jgi:outer membrane receptor for Fe3+-dicitrate
MKINRMCAARAGAGGAFVFALMVSAVHHAWGQGATSADESPKTGDPQQTTGADEGQPKAPQQTAPKEVHTAETEVIGHYETGVGTTDAASAGTVTYRRIDATPQLRPGEVIQLVPGMAVTQHSGDGKANQYFLRGYNLDHGTDFAIWVDGMPVNLPTHGHGQGYADINFMIPELIQGMDFVKGPYYATGTCCLRTSHWRPSERTATGGGWWPRRRKSGRDT